MVSFKIPHAKAEKATSAAKVTSIRKVGASSGISSQEQDAHRGPQVKPFAGGLDPNGNCRISTFGAVSQDYETMISYPYSRCYTIESTASSGQVLKTSGFALSATRVLTSNAHVVNIEQRSGLISVGRSYVYTSPDGSTTTFDQHTTSRVASWGDDENEANIGLRYCMLSMSDDPLTITDGEGDQVFTTILSVLAINPEPTLQLITREVTDGTLMIGSANGAPRRITNGSVAEWFVTDLGGWLGRYNSADFWDFLRGSPIFVEEESGPVDGPLTTKMWLVGLVTDEVVASSPCTVNAGLFVDDGAVTRLSNAL